VDVNTPQPNNTNNLIEMQTTREMDTLAMDTNTHPFHHNNNELPHNDMLAALVSQMAEHTVTALLREVHLMRCTGPKNANTDSDMPLACIITHSDAHSTLARALLLADNERDACIALSVQLRDITATLSHLRLQISADVKSIFSDITTPAHSVAPTHRSIAQLREMLDNLDALTAAPS
jgi:hypothetical protein